MPALEGSTWFWFHDRPVWLTPWAPGYRARPDDLHGCRHGARPFARVAS